MPRLTSDLSLSDKFSLFHTSPHAYSVTSFCISAPSSSAEAKALSTYSSPSTFLLFAMPFLKISLSIDNPYKICLLIKLIPHKNKAKWLI